MVRPISDYKVEARGAPLSSGHPVLNLDSMFYLSF